MCDRPDEKIEDHVERFALFLLAALDRAAPDWGRPHIAPRGVLEIGSQ